MFHHTATSITVSVVALIIAGLIWTVGRQRWPLATLILVVGGAGGIVGTTIGRFVHEALDALYTWIGQFCGPLLGIGVGTVAIITAIVLGFIVGFHIHHKAIGDKTLMAAALIPWAAPFAPGVLGVLLSDVVSACVALVASIGYFLFHGHL